MTQETPLERVAEAYSSKNGEEPMEVLEDLIDEELRDLYSVLEGIQGSIESVLGEEPF